MACVYPIGPNGDASVVVEGTALARPQRHRLRPDGSIVVVHINDHAVLTFSPDGSSGRSTRRTAATPTTIVELD